jgi:AbrB family looped-hinge helix DNA binding protein
MRANIDGAGRIVVPKALREQLGFAAGTELKLDAIDGRLEVTVPSRVVVEQGPHGVRFAAIPTGSAPDRFTVAQVCDLVERGRR